jgi:23S rRNA pseudouridine2605 synthase
MTLTENEGVRLQKVLAAAGVASRRVCEDLITKGRVRVNGKVVTELGSRIFPEVDQVQVDNRPIQLDPDRVYIAFHKPRGVVSTMADENGRPCLADYFVGFDRVFNVGRLDAETTGLILMTNDGEMANQLAHPSYEVQKLYVAKVRGKITRVEMQKLLDGVKLEDGLQKADSARVIDQNEQSSLVEIVLHSGKNRIVRRMFEAIGFPVIDLTRKSFGPLRLGNIKPGQFRELSKLEVSSLMEAAQGSKGPRKRR